jgi:hypothetical protein
MVKKIVKLDKDFPAISLDFVRIVSRVRIVSFRRVSRETIAFCRNFFVPLPLRTIVSIVSPTSRLCLTIEF